MRLLTYLLAYGIWHQYSADISARHSNSFSLLIRGPNSPETLKFPLVGNPMLGIFTAR